MAAADLSPSMILARTRFGALLVLLPLAIAFAATGEPLWRWLPLAIMVVGLLILDRLGDDVPQRIAVNMAVIAPAAIIQFAGGVACPLAGVLVVNMAGSALATGPTPGMWRRVAIGIGAVLLAIALDDLPGFTPRVLDRALPLGARASPLLWGYTLIVFLAMFAHTMAMTRAHLDATRAQAVSLEADLAAGLRDRNRELTAISGSLAHELKNPLASIQGLATHLARKAEGPQAEQLGVMIGEIHRMGDILDGLLDVARPLGSLSLVDVDLADIAREVVQMHAPFAAEHGATLSAEGKARARVDPRKIRQILVNLVLNAVEAGAKRVDLSVAPGPRIEVRDDGGGFEGDPTRFFASGVTTKATGNGLGLAICAAIAEQHGGAITLANRGAGCVATLDLGGAA